MTIQAQNSLTLYKGQNPLMIKYALSMQKDSIVDELKDSLNEYINIMCVTD